MAISGMFSRTEGATESLTILRAGLPLWRQITAETGLQYDYRRRASWLRLNSALRLDLPQPGWTPFFQLGIGLDGVNSGPFFDYRLAFQGGTGALIPLAKRAALRLDYQIQRVRANPAHFTRQHFLIGVQLKWLKA